ETPLLDIDIEPSKSPEVPLTQGLVLVTSVLEVGLRQYTKQRDLRRQSYVPGLGEGTLNEGLDAAHRGIVVHRRRAPVGDAEVQVAYVQRKPQSHALVLPAVPVHELPERLVHVGLGGHSDSLP